MTSPWKNLLPDLHADYLEDALHGKPLTGEKAGRIRAIENSANESAVTILRGLAVVGSMLAEAHDEMEPTDLVSVGLLVHHLAHLGADLAFLEVNANSYLNPPAEAINPAPGRGDPVQRLPLADYATNRQAQTAKRLGMSPRGLSKAIREGRQIFVTEAPDGAICAVEEKPFPSQRRDLGRPQSEVNNG